MKLLGVILGILLFQVILPILVLTIVVIIGAKLMGFELDTKPLTDKIKAIVQ
jgi:hypothetical protein